MEADWCDAQRSFGRSTFDLNATFRGARAGVNLEAVFRKQQGAGETIPEWPRKSLRWIAWWSPLSRASILANDRPVPHPRFGRGNST
jgi:hypothetical protein